ncbi:MAG: hypothetical protein ACYC7E_10905 [Armatimonadota bacterium]
MRSCFYLLIALIAGSAFAADIVTMPTANQLKQGEVDISAYYLDLNLGGPAPKYVNYQTLYVGLTDWLELDVHRADADIDKTSFVLVGSIKLLSETPTRPDVVIGARNITQEATTLSPFAEESKETSYFLSTAKTFFFTDVPGPPLVRVHLSVGTADNTLLGEERHEGVFGGFQFLLAPTVGAVVQHDGTDLITAVTFMPNKHLTFKAGTYGKHRWVGISFLTDVF